MGKKKKEERKRNAAQNLPLTTYKNVKLELCLFISSKV